MDIFRAAQHRFRQLDEQRIIDLKWMQIWLVMVVATFCTITWVWERLVMEDDPISHYPPSLIPLELRKKLPSHGFVNEYEARKFSIREAEVALIGCKSDGVAADKSAMDVVTLMKSAALLSKSVIHFHIFTDDNLYPSFMQELDKWPSYVRHRVSFQLRHLGYPESLLGWKSAERPCAPFKLFLPTVLKQQDFLIHIDSESVFINSFDSLWSRLLKFNSSQTISLGASLIENSPLSKYGIKSFDTRILLIDNFKLRHTLFRVPVEILENGDFIVTNSTWHPNMLRGIYNLFHEDMTAPDKDILSVLYHFNPEKFDFFPCQWSFRWKYCEWYLASVKSRFLNMTLKNWPLEVKPAPCNNAFLIHNSRSQTSFHDHSEFNTIQSIWQNASYNNSESDFLKSLDGVYNRRKEEKHSPCFRINMKYLKNSFKAAAT